MRRQSAVLQHAGIGSQAHGPALGIDGFLLGHQMDDRMRRLQVKLARVGARQAANMPGKLDHGHLHAETDPEKRNAVLARIANRRDLALAAAIAKTAGNENSIGIFEQGFAFFLFDLFRFDTVEFNANVVGNAAVNKCLEQTLVRLL